MFDQFVDNFVHNLFQPLLLFFYLGFLIPLLKVPFEFPKALYQSLTIYLLVAIGWHGGEKMAGLQPDDFAQAGGFIVIGFVTNFFIGIVAYLLLSHFTRLRQIDAATVAGYYGSDSAGTFVTCQGILMAAGLTYAGYMPVMLAVMEIPGCLVALYLVSRLRHQGMDANGNMPGDPEYLAQPVVAQQEYAHDEEEEEASGHGHNHGGTATAVQPATRVNVGTHTANTNGMAGNGHGHGQHGEKHSIFSPALLHEVFLNPGLYLLFGSIIVGFISASQGDERLIAGEDMLFDRLFHGVLCLFLLEMGMTACKRLKDLRTAGLPFILYGVLAPNLFAATGIVIAHIYSLALGQPFAIGTYTLFAVLCAAASYIAVPAVQRIAIPEASPTLPLAASLGLTFSYNVTLGIPLYIIFAQIVTAALPVGVSG